MRKGTEMKALRNVSTVIIVLVSLTGGYAQDPKDKPVENSKAAKHVKVKYDKGKDLTTITLNSLAVSSAVTKEVSRLSEGTQLDLSVFFTHPGQQLSKPVDTLTMKFKSTSKYPVFQRGQNLMVVLDNERAIPIGDATYSSRSETFYVEEMLTGPVPYEIMKRIAGAKSASFFLGAREIKLKEDQLDDLREITKRMAP
jgi:hypothetical protein